MKLDQADLRFDTLAIHAGQEPDPITGALMTPVYLNSTYAQRGPGEHQGFEYARTRNPTRDALQGCLAALEGGPRALAFASGLAATDAVLHLLQAGDRVVYSDDLYGGTFRIFDQVHRRHGLDFEPVDLTDLSALDRALERRPKLVWMESPTNPMLKVVDLAAVAARARAAGALAVVDNTFATPFFQRPLSLGVDLVLHSTTKYLNGHSDVVGGALVAGDQALHERLRLPPERGGRRAGAARLLPRAARPEDAARAHGAPRAATPSRWPASWSRTRRWSG